MPKLSRSILLLICLTILVACDSAQMQEKQSNETQSEKISQPNNLFVVMVNKKYGFIDKRGNVLIEPQFEFANDFAEGLAFIGIRNDELKSAYIDEKGKVTISLQTGASDFSEGLAAFGVGEFTMHGGGDHKFGFIDKTGKTIIGTNFREARAFSEGLSAVMNDERKWGYIDQTGKVIIPFQFEDAFSFSEDLACVLTRGLFGFIDKSGKIVIEPRFATPSQFREGLAAVELPVKDFKPYQYYGTYVRSLGEVLFIDRTGNTIIKFDRSVKKINDFSEGLASVEAERKERDFYTRFIDKQGKIIFDLPFYSSQVIFSEGLARIEQKDRYGFIDKTGKIIIKPVYRWAENFHNGLAKISTGKQVWDFEGTENLGFEPNLGYIDKTGKVIWQPTK